MTFSVSASPQDIGVLTRKLYAAFEALPGKVALVNPRFRRISRNRI
ncbi:class I adenylate cyclase [Shigella flexneri]